MRKQIEQTIKRVRGVCRCALQMGLHNGCHVREEELDKIHRLARVLLWIIRVPPNQWASVRWRSAVA